MEPSEASDLNNKMTSDQMQIDLNRKQVDALKEKLNMKVTALNAIKANRYQSDDSKVKNIFSNKK